LLWLVPYLLALGTTVLVTAALLPLREAINPPVVALLYLLLVGLSTAAWGLGPGVTAALLAFLAFNYFFIPPYNSLLVHETQDLLALIVFLLVAGVMNQIVGRARQNLASANAREREAVRLYELSTGLAGLSDDQPIAQMLALQVQETFLADRVEVALEGEAGGPGLFAVQPDRAPGSASASTGEPAGRPALLVPLQTARSLLGEIRLWRERPPLSPAEERLLRTFASQGVLALERARLAKAATRARILEESDQLKTSLLNSVSHELRTPLATIKAAATSLQDGEIEWDSQARCELLAAIEEETDHLNQLVGNLLNMSRLEAGALRPQRNWNLISEIVSGVLAHLRLRSHLVELEIPDDLPLVPVDYVLMEQVFSNLLSNSIKYSPEGSVIRVRARQWDERSLLVQVINQGPPVPEEHLEGIFDKFYRVTAAERVTGTGLGLSICKGIVEAHGGQIWAENLPEGFCFNFTLPITWEGSLPRLPEESQQ
jgi:two-component system sensor histidine kinase KdpD